MPQSYPVIFGFVRRSIFRDGRNRITILACIALIVQFVIVQTVNAERLKRPNFVLIMADDLGYGDLSCYDGWIETPHLDRLAAKGTRFTDFHSSGVVCSPTRAGLMTGRYQQRAGIPGVVFAAPNRPEHEHGLQDVEVTLAEQLKAAGYKTGIFGKWHLGYYEKYNPTNHGFDQFVGYVSGNIDFFSHIDQAGVFDWWHGTKKHKEAGYSTHLITRYSVEFIEANKESPFFLYVPHEAPHYPFQGPNDKAERTVGGKFNTQGARPDKKQAYREMVAEMDKGIGEIMDALKRYNLLEDTFVFFLSDNGAARWGKNAPLRGQKGTVWEGGHRVPAIAHWPGRVPACTSRQLSISLDIMPTFLKLAGVAESKERPSDGMDLMPFLTSEKVTERTLFWNGKAVRQGPWKLVVGGKGDKKKATRLYNLDDDLKESRDLAGKNPKKVKQLRAALKAWKADVAKDQTVQP